MNKHILGFIFLMTFCMEVSSIIIVGQYVGVLWTLFLLFLNMIVAASLITKSGRNMVMQVQNELAQGRNPDKTMVKSLLMFIAGILFFIPGFISDILAAALLIPVVQSRVWLYIKKYFGIDTKYYNKHYTNNYSGFSSNNDDIIIDLDNNDYHQQNDEKRGIK